MLANQYSTQSMINTQQYLTSDRYLNIDRNIIAAMAAALLAPKLGTREKSTDRRWKEARLIQIRNNREFKGIQYFS